MKQASIDLEKYKNYLDDLSTQTLLRIENLSQIEISLFERELALQTKEDANRMTDPDSQALNDKHVSLCLRENALKLAQFQFAMDKSNF